MNKKKEISIIIPVYNEEENIEKLFFEIKDICEKNNYTYEIIIVDDGSTDNTERVINKLTPIKYIKFRKNFGQTAAIDAGIKYAKFNYIITIDGDGQNDPKDIPLLIKTLEENDYDVVSGWRKNRKDNIFKIIVSRVANLLRKFLINDKIHDSGCTLKIYKKECFENINLYGEMHRFIPALLKIKGYKIGEVIVNHRKRLKGKTKYNWHRAIKGFIDMISVWFWNKYAVRPLHLLGGLGLIFIILGMISGFYSLYLFFIEKVNLSDYLWPLLSAFLFLAGLQLFVSGLIADILTKNYFETTKNSYYSIKKIIEN